MDVHPNSLAADTRRADEFLLEEDETFVRAIYWIVLGREPESSGLHDNVEPLRAGGARANLLYTICRSREAELAGVVPFQILNQTWDDRSFRAESFLLESDASFIRVGFKVLLGREPRASELTLHVQQLEAGQSRWSALDHIQNLKATPRKQTPKLAELRSAEEFLLRDNEAFVRAIYWIVLGREPENGGLHDNIKHLRAGSGRANLLQLISQSSEAECAGLFRFEVLKETWDDSLFQAECALLASDAAFVRVGFKLLLGREPEGSEHEIQLKQLHAGRSRWDVLDQIQFLVTVPGASGVRSAEEFLLSDDNAFITAGYLTLLGRRPDEEGLRNHIEFLNSGLSRWHVLRGLSSSDEGQAHSPNYIAAPPDDGGPEQLSAEKALLRRDEFFVRVLVDFMPGEASSSELEKDCLKRLQAGERRWNVLDALRRSHMAAQQAAQSEGEKNKKFFGVYAARSLSSTTFILLPGHSSPSLFLRNIIKAWTAQGYSARLVTWNADQRCFQVTGSKALQRLDVLGHLRGDFLSYAAEDGLELPVDRSSCGKGDSLLVPESFRDEVHGSRLVEVDVIVEARRLGLRNTFIYHDSEPLRSVAATTTEAALHEQYMQALLLADLVIPVGLRAADDLRLFFLQHQSANSIPLVKKVSLPVGIRGDDDQIQWSNFVRNIRGLATNVSRELDAIYYYIDDADRAEFSTLSLRLADSFWQRDVRLIPVQMDGVSRKLVVSATHPTKVSQRESIFPVWSEWIDPDELSAPRWIFVPNIVQSHILAGIIEYANANNLRVAIILHDGFSIDGEVHAPVDHRRITIDLSLYAKMDKVFCSSKRCLQELSQALLTWRGKVNSAEHRFKALSTPNELPRHPKRVHPKRVVDQAFRVLAHVDCSSDPSPLFDAARRVSQYSDAQFSFVFLPTSNKRPSWNEGAVKSMLDAIPHASVVGDPTDIDYRALLESADIVIASVSDPGNNRDVIDALWCGLPCVVHQGYSGATHGAELGVVSVDLNDSDELSKTILKLTDKTWRHYISGEAISIVPRLWNDYARDIAVELMADRLTDSLYMPGTNDERDVYKWLPNLKPRPKLSLCISTYKRAGWLSLNLKNIFNQVSNPRQDLEILVVDNASPDATKDVITPYLERMDFRYHRNLANVGMLGNLAVTAQMARGEYIWIIGDDDLTRPGVIEHVLDILHKEQDLQLIYMNYGYTSEQNPDSVKDLDKFLAEYNELEPGSQDEKSTVKALATKTENFYTAIYCHIYKRDHALRAYCQDTSGRIFSTMSNCIPTTLYVLSYMADAPAYWIGEPALVVNSNVSWVDYASLFELEQFPRAWDLAERTGSVPAEVDRRRGDRLWMIEKMWENVFINDKGGNCIYISAPRVLMRLKHLDNFEEYLPRFKAIYYEAYQNGHPSASMAPADLFAACAG